MHGECLAKGFGGLPCVSHLFDILHTCRLKCKGLQKKEMMH